MSDDTTGALDSRGRIRDDYVEGVGDAYSEEDRGGQLAAPSGGVPDGAFSPRNMSQLMQWANVVQASGLLPDHIRSASDVVLLVQQGHELGLSPTQSLQNLYVVEGKVSMPAMVAVSLCLESDLCRYFRSTVSTDERAEYETKRADDPSGDPITEVFTWGDAERAGLTGKKNWSRYPKDMLRNRAAIKLARRVYPDVLLGGGVYTPDEVGAETDRHGVPNSGSTGQASTEATVVDTSEGESSSSPDDSGGPPASDLEVEEYDGGQESDGASEPEQSGQESDPEAPESDIRDLDEERIESSDVFGWLTKSRLFSPTFNGRDDEGRLEIEVRGEFARVEVDGGQRARVQYEHGPSTDWHTERRELVDDLSSIDLEESDDSGGQELVPGEIDGTDESGDEWTSEKRSIAALITATSAGDEERRRFYQALARKWLHPSAYSGDVPKVEDLEKVPARALAIERRALDDHASSTPEGADPAALSPREEAMAATVDENLPLEVRTPEQAELD